MTRSPGGTDSECTDDARISEHVTIARSGNLGGDLRKIESGRIPRPRSSTSRARGVLASPSTSSPRSSRIHWHLSRLSTPLDPNAIDIAVVMTDAAGTPDGPRRRDALGSGGRPRAHRPIGLRVRPPSGRCPGSGVCRSRVDSPPLSVLVSATSKTSPSSAAQPSSWPVVARRPDG